MAEQSYRTAISRATSPRNNLCQLPPTICLSVIRVGRLIAAACRNGTWNMYLVKKSENCMNICVCMYDLCVILE